MSGHRQLRRKVTIVACLAVVVGLAPASASVGVGPEAASTSTWSQPFADAAQSNHNRGETVLTADDIASQQLRPAYSLAGLPFFGTCGGIWTLDMRRPVMAGGNLYAYDGREVEAHDLATGDLLWRSADITGADGSSFPTSVTLAGDSVLVAGLTSCESTSDPNGFIMSFDISDGHTRWVLRPDGPVAEVTVRGSTMVVETSETAQDPPTLGAYDVTSGASTWSRGRKCDGNTFFVVGTRVVTNSRCGTVGLANGRTVWTKPHPLDWTFIRGDGPGVSTPSIYAKKPNGALVALRPDGTTRWNAGQRYGDVLATGPGMVYVACLGDGSICALDQLTGAELWTRAVDRLVGAVTASDFAVLPGDGTVLRASDGVPISNLGITGGIWQAAAVADGRIVAVEGRDIDIFELRP